MLDTADADNADPLMAAIGSDQAIMRRLQSLVVSRIVCLLGIRWASSVQRGQISPIVQSIVVAARLGGITSAEQYNAKKIAGLKGDFMCCNRCSKRKTRLQTCAKQHHDSAQTLLMPFFEEIIDDMVDHIRSTLFNVNRPLPWGPIVSPNNQVTARRRR